MEKLDTLLVEHPLFKGLDKRYLELIAGCASNVRFEAGDFIFRERENADRFYLIRHGQIAIEVFRDRRGSIVLETIGEGEVLGWSWLFPPHRWTFDARAVTLVRAISMDGACIRKKCEEDHAMGYKLVTQFAHIIMQRLHAARLRLIDIYGNQD